MTYKENNIMGLRDYEGDISGKFWGVQTSDDADFFGVEGALTTLEYGFEQANLPAITSGIQVCLDNLGEWYPKLDDFFQMQLVNSGFRKWNEEIIQEAIGIPKNQVNYMVRWYARLELGQKIKSCIEEDGSCHFSAEL